MAKRVVHATQTKARQAIERDGSLSESWSRRLTPTEQYHPRPAENGPSTHNQIEERVEKGSRELKGDGLRLGSRKDEDTKIERETEPASEGTREDGSCFGRRNLLGDLTIQVAMMILGGWTLIPLVVMRDVPISASAELWSLSSGLMSGSLEIRPSIRSGAASALGTDNHFGG